MIGNSTIMQKSYNINKSELKQIQLRNQCATAATIKAAKPNIVINFALYLCAKSQASWLLRERVVR